MALPEILLKSFDEKSVFAKDGKIIPLAGNIKLSEAELLYSVVKAVSPDRSLEIGFGQGISTLAILGALKENSKGEHHVLDPFQKEYDYTGIEMVRRAGLNDLFTFHEDFAENVVPILDTIDFAFIDSSHLFDLTMIDFIFTDRKLRNGGVIGFHDLDFPSIRKLIKYILCNHEYKIYPDPQILHNYKKNYYSDFKSFRSLTRRIYYELHKPMKLKGFGNIIFLQKIGSLGEKYRGFKDF